MRFQFTNPLAIYPATYVWKVYPRQQSGYYTTFYWANNGAFYWDGGSPNTYYGAHPFPTPTSTSSTHRWKMSVDGGGFVNDANGHNTTVAYGRWYTQALRVWSDAAGKHHEFYWDLPDTSRVIRVVIPSRYGNTMPPSPVLVWGDAPWNPSNEMFNGVLRGIQVYSASLSVADMLSEATTPMSTTAGASNIWYLNTDPTPTDISDKSGRGHHPTWVGSERPLLWTGPDQQGVPAPDVSLIADPVTVSEGSSSTLIWASQNATGCTASGSWSGSRPTSGSASTGPLLAPGQNFTLSCTGAGGTTSKSVSVTVIPPVPAPTLSLSANPAQVNSGSSSTLSWSSTNADSCTASGAWSGNRSTSGSASTGALSSTSTYTLNCTGAGGSVSRSATVTVTTPVPAPTLSFSANPTQVNSGSSSTLSWSSTNASSCTASGAWSGNRSTSGSASTGALSSTSTYTLNCTGAGGSISRSVTVTVTTPVPAPTLSLSANPTQVSSGGSSLLSWSASNADGCTASGAWSGSRAVSGSEMTEALSATRTYTLTCTGAGGSVNRSTTVTVTGGGSGGVTGLDFLGNASTTGTVRFQFTNPLAIYPATYVWKVYPRQQSGYYTTFFWGNNGAFYWDGGSPNTYYGAHPYPNPPPSGTAHRWELAVDGGDVVADANGNNTTVVYGRWYTQALRVWSDAAGKHHEFYWDLPDTSRVIRAVIPSRYGNTMPPSPVLVWGDAPWNPSNEIYNGVLRGIQVYSASLSVADMLSEATTPMSTTAGASNIWYLNTDPTPTDISDKSGRGHHPTWVGSERPLLWTGP